MKAILPLLLLFLGSVYSQEDVIYCNFFDRCPKGYKRRDSGTSNLKSVCLCQRIPTEDELCARSAKICVSGFEPFCMRPMNDCPSAIVAACNNLTVELPEMCDDANQIVIKKNTTNYGFDETLCNHVKLSCDSTKLSARTACDNLPQYCDPNSVIEYCKRGKIDNTKECIGAERKLEKQETEKTKYRCSYAVDHCLKNGTLVHCRSIPGLCDSKTTAEFCYKNLISDEAACASAINKFQRLNERIDESKCSQQVQQCERGDFEACIQVPTICGKDVVSALCNAKKITNTITCTYAGLENVVNSSYPGCDSFSKKCSISDPNSDTFYCDLASRYCDSKTIVTLCNKGLIPSVFACRNAKNAIS